MLRAILLMTALGSLVPLGAARAEDAASGAPHPAPGMSADGTGGSGGGAELPNLKGLTLFLDAGHGGLVEGAIGVHGEKEKRISLQIVLRLRDELQKAGAKVLLTRGSDVDVDLWDRMAWANRAHADLFLSVHCNAVPPQESGRALSHGVETYFLSADATAEQAQRVVALENGEARRLKRSADPLASILDDLAQTEAHHDASALAYAVHQHLVKDLGAADRGVQQAPFVVLMGAQMPAVLVEVGFLTHPAESKLLASEAYQSRIASALLAGIAAFVEERRHKPSNEVSPPATGGGDAKAATAPVR